MPDLKRDLIPASAGTGAGSAPSRGQARAPALTFITTCRGRLHHLQQTLPRLLAQPGSHCIVVDYACPDRCGEWVEHNLPAARVVRWPQAATFNPSHARNLGAAAADTQMICLIDVDVLAAPGLAVHLLSQFDPRRYLLPQPMAGDISGTFACARSAFEFAEDYDEACSGWGGEDFDLYERLEFHGLQRGAFPAQFLSALPHPDSERTAHHAIADKEFTNSVNLLYSHIKLDLMKLSGSRIPLDYRRTLHHQVHDAYVQSAATRTAVRIEVAVADILVNDCRLQSELVYDVDVTRQQ